MGTNDPICSVYIWDKNPGNIFQVSYMHFSCLLKISLNFTIVLKEHDSSFEYTYSIMKYLSFIGLIAQFL